MKIFLQRLIPAVIPVIILSCASTGVNNESKESSTAEPVFDDNSPRRMDENWALYFSTGNEKYLENIIAYTDTEDLLTETLNKERSRVASDEKFMNILKSFGARITDESIEFPSDFEMLSAFYYKNEETKENLEYIYRQFPWDLFVRGVHKNTAFWSILSNAKQYKNINIAVQKRIPYMRPKVQANYYDYMNLTKKIGFIKSDHGNANYKNDDIWINIVLVNDIKETINQWKALKTEEAPYIKTALKADRTNNSIVPFIMYCCTEDRKDFPLYYDCELIDPDGTVGEYRGTKLKFAETNPGKPLFYSVLQNYGWTFDETDPDGKYAVRITVYSEDSVISVFELSFNLEM